MGSAELIVASVSIPFNCVSLQLSRVECWQVLVVRVEPSSLNHLLVVIHVWLAYSIKDLLVVCGDDTCIVWNWVVAV